MKTSTLINLVLATLLISAVSYNYIGGVSSTKVLDPESPIGQVNIEVPMDSEEVYLMLDSGPAPVLYGQIPTGTIYLPAKSYHKFVVDIQGKVNGTDVESFLIKTLKIKGYDG